MIFFYGLMVIFWWKFDEDILQLIDRGILHWNDDIFGVIDMFIFNIDIDIFIKNFEGDIFLEGDNDIF